MLALLALLLAATLPVRSQSHARPNVSCRLEQANFDVYDAQTRTQHEVEDWRVTCRVTRGDEVLFDRRLPMAYPANCNEATTTMCEFMHEGWKRYIREDK